MLYKALIGFKHSRAADALFEIIEDDNENVLSYYIGTALVCINFSDMTVPAPVDSSSHILFISSKFEIVSATELSPFEARIYSERS